MSTEKLNSRQIKSNESRDKIYEVAIRLFSKKGMEKTTIREICHEAGMSVGSFYNHFKSKEDIIYVTFKMADIDFENLNKFGNHNKDIKEIIFEYMDYYMNFVQTYDFEFIKILYNTTNFNFVQDKRPMQENLKKILRNKDLVINPKYVESVDDLVEMLFMISRGIIFHWCLKDASFDLNQMAKMQIDIILNSVLLI